MRVSELLKKYAIPTALISALIATATGSFPPLADAYLRKWLGMADTWMVLNVEFPIATIFLATLLLAWAIYWSLIVSIGQRRNRARIKLAKLRIEGTALRQEGATLNTTAALDRWLGKLREWRDQVSNTISIIDKADAISFRHLGYPGKTREYPAMTFISTDHAKQFAFHDIFEQRLEKYINKYGG